MIDDEDRAFWLEEVKGIKKSSSSVVVNPPNSVKSINQEKHCYAVKQEYSTYSKYLEDMDNGGIDKSTLRKFKREEFKIEAILDLHGLTEDPAFEKVDNFIVQSYNLGRRCVVIVTGKGGIHQNDDIFAPRGVLKQRVPQWLEMPRLRAMILVYKHPTERLGGSGALYILLRRNKDI